ncbi:Rrp15p-domain-containing protein, partial [Piedraia hortae CBS 480.64]
MAGEKRPRPTHSERKPKKKIRIKQKVYHSSSEDEAPRSILKKRGIEPPVLEGGETDDLAVNTALNTRPQHPSSPSDSDDDNDDGDDIIDTDSDISTRKVKKRNDPDAFARSMAKVLGTKLSTSKRADPVLSRSKAAKAASLSMASQRLDNRAKAQLRAERKMALEKGRVRDVMGLGDSIVDSGAIQQEEKRLRKMAQRGVITLFNAIRAAQVKAEEGNKVAVAEGVVGMKQREEMVNEMSKKGFLDLISGK